ncbi:RNA polymerase III transcription factor IIIC subunit-domain-containing protein [Dipodascopsis uninucleata]
MSLNRQRRWTCIEHPAVVKNVDRAIETLGGTDALRKTIRSDGKESLELCLRPEDRFAHSITSRANTSAHSVVLAVRVKKAWLKEYNGDLHKVLAAHPNEYTTKPCAVIDCSVRFREMADFQYSTANSQFIQRLQNSMFVGSLEELQKLNFSSSRTDDESKSLDIPPPPRFSRITVPFDYGYRQNPAVTAVTDDTGNTKLINRSVAQRLFSIVVRWADTAVPDAKYPEKNLKAPARDSKLPEIISVLEQKFNERPIWTRRALEEGALPEKWRHLWSSHVKYALPYVAFTWKSGPWRATYTKYGIDPRKVPELRIYQTEYFRISPKEEEILESNTSRLAKSDVKTEGGEDINKSSDFPSYIFDGTHLPIARSFQLCDITDPVIVSLLEQSELRDTVDEKDGWYKASTMSKVRRIMRLKLKALWSDLPISQMELSKIIEEESDDDMATNAMIIEVDSSNKGKDSVKAVSETSNKSELSSNERDMLKAVNEASGSTKGLQQLLGILQQEDNEGGPIDDADEYEIFDDDDDDPEIEDGDDDAD